MFCRVVMAHSSSDVLYGVSIDQRTTQYIQESTPPTDPATIRVSFLFTRGTSLRQRDNVMDSCDAMPSQPHVLTLDAG